jgi:hypothetical protein
MFINSRLTFFRLNHFFFIVFICVLLLPCNSLYAEGEVCYPDQSPLCKGVSKLEWNGSNPAEIGENDEQAFSIIGGRGSYTWTVSGSGFFLDQAGTLKTLITNSPDITLYTIGACGTGTITIKDGCSTIVGYVRSTNGRWVTIDPPMECLSGGIESGSVPNMHLYTWEMETPRYSQQQDSYGGGLLVITAHTLSCSETPTKSDYQAEADAWCNSICDSIPFNNSKCSSDPYCAGSVFSECISDVTIYSGFCYWHIDGSVAFGCGRRCVSRNNWKEFQCNE